MSDVQVIIGTSKPKKRGFHPFAWFITYGESFEVLLRTGKWELQEESHMYIRWTSRGAGVNITYHASGTSIQFLCEDVFVHKNQIVKEFISTIPSEKYSKLLTFCMSNAGRSYGVRGIIGLIYVKLAKLCGIKKRNPYADGMTSMWCNELIGYYLRDVLDLPEAQEIDWESMGVRDTVAFLQKLNQEGKL